jgi:fumarate hydratase, class I
MHALVLKCSTELPDDVDQALWAACDQEESGSIARETLSIMRESAALSLAGSLPICQDTGSVFAVIHSEPSPAIYDIDEALRGAIRDLTEQGVLRQNCVDTLTDKNTGDNLGAYVPQIHCQMRKGPTTVRLMLKGGGSENVSTQYSLPDTDLGAGRDFDGARRCILDAVFKAQGKGCAPGILGVCIGGDRAAGYYLAKEQLFRKLTDVNPDETLARFEQEVYAQANRLGIGPMGLGGKATILGVKAANAGRHPASYFVSVSYSCWATRRYGVELDGQGRIARWL